MIKTVLLGISLVANVALTALALGARPQVAQSGRPPHSAASGIVGPGAGSAAGLYRRLRGLGLDEHEARLLLSAELEAAAAARVPRSEIRYWKTGLAAAADYRLGVAKAQRSVRGELDAVFGAEAASAPEFASVYRPLDVELGFLDSTAQVAVNEWRLSRSAARSRDRGPVAGASRDPARSLNPMRSAVPPMLSSGDAFEYALRVSPLADALRASGVDFTEPEFRAAYQTLAQAEKRSGDVGAQIEARRALRNLLGTRRFERVWGTRDPTFEVLARACKELGLEDGTGEAVYSVMNDAQERLLALAAEGPLDAARAAALVHDVVADERRRLEKLVGVDVADKLLRARAKALLGLSRPSQ